MKSYNLNNAHSKNIMIKDKPYDNIYFKKHYELSIKYKNGIDIYGKKWEKVNILELEADQLSEYCREFGLYYERSDKGMPKFDYESYLWDGNIPDKNVWYQEKSLPDSTGNKD